MTANSVNSGNGANQPTFTDPQTGYAYTVDSATGQSVWVTDPQTGLPVKGQTQDNTSAQGTEAQSVQTNTPEQPVAEPAPSFETAQTEAPFQAYTSQPFYDNPHDANVGSMQPEFANIPEPQPSSGLAVAALVLGILALLFSFIPVLNFGSFIMGLLGIILGIVGIVKASKGAARGKGMAIAGIILSLLAFVLGAVINSVFFNMLEEEGLYDTVVSTSSSAAVSTSSSAAVSTSSSVPEGVSALSSSADASSEANVEAASGKTYKVGETWTVDGQWEFTITGVKSSDERTEYANQNPQAVYIVDYTYTNLGFEDTSGIFDGLIIFADDTIVDAGGKLGYSYPGETSLFPQEAPVGATCDAQACIGVDNPGPFTLTVSEYDSEGNRHKATFKVEV